VSWRGQPEAGAGTVSIALAAAAAVITLGATDVLTPVTAERAVCLVRSVPLLDRGASCDAADGEPGGKPPLRLAQFPEPNRSDVERRLRGREAELNRYFGAAPKRPGAPSAPPRVTIVAPPGYVRDRPDRAQLDPASIELFVEDRGDLEDQLAQATLTLALNFAQLAQGDYLDPALSFEDAMRGRVLLADCMAGAWAARAGIEGDTLRRMQDFYLRLPNEDDQIVGGGRQRLDQFRNGLDRGRTTDDPFAACELST
jgi:hypothetical protein